MTLSDVKINPPPESRSFETVGDFCPDRAWAGRCKLKVAKPKVSPTDCFLFYSAYKSKLLTLHKTKKSRFCGTFVFTCDPAATDPPLADRTL
jgi:hypothetical protein